MYVDGIDIESQKTNEQLDDEDDQLQDAIMCSWDIDWEVQKLNHKPVFKQGSLTNKSTFTDFKSTHDLKQMNKQ